MDNKRYFLAVDIGASSGRHILGTLDSGNMELMEVHRFTNGASSKNGHMVWDTEELFQAVVEGIGKCAQLGKIPETMAIDTWGVDFALLGAKGEVLGDIVAYRDKRTAGMDAVAEQKLSFEEHYSRTGIQKQSYNTVYQLLALKKEDPQLLEKAEKLLMMPQYLNYRLTGVAAMEYTQATTTGLVNAEEKDWDMELIEKLGLPKKIFLPLNMPGQAVGRLKPELAQQLKMDVTVVHCASHDTGSAFLAVPALNDHSVYLSSGTWSLLGVENTKPFTGEESRKANFTNEGGYAYRYRYLKNIMGLWMIQSVRKDLDKKYSFQELEEMARAESGFKGRVNVDDQRFLAPENMVEEVSAASTVKPENVGQLMECIYCSLARCYADAITELSALTGKKYTDINIVGGGSKDGYLNALTAKLTGLPVHAGPTEGTAIGNILVQMLAAGDFESLQQARDCVRKSFNIKTFN